MHIGFESDMYNIAHNVTQFEACSSLIHFHTKYEILYMVEGDATFSMGGAEYPMRPHTLLFIPPNVFHGIHVREGTVYDRYTVHFEPAMLSREHRALLLGGLPDRAGKACCVYDMERSGILEMLRQFDDLDAAPRTLHGPLTPILLHALIARILLALPGGEQEEGAARRALPQSELLQYIDEHFTEPVTLDTLSAHFYLSKSQLNQTFRQMTGTTIIDYIIRKRVDYAQQLLFSGVPAHQAGAAAGFGDYTSFYRAYKKHFGQSPMRDKRETNGGPGEPEANEYLTEGFRATLSEMQGRAQRDEQAH